MRLGRIATMVSAIALAATMTACGSSEKTGGGGGDTASA
jgi:hypothetical protein